MESIDDKLKEAAGAVLVLAGVLAAVGLYKGNDYAAGLGTLGTAGAAVYLMATRREEDVPKIKDPRYDRR